MDTQDLFPGIAAPQNSLFYISNQYSEKELRAFGKGDERIGAFISNLHDTYITKNEKDPNYQYIFLLLDDRRYTSGTIPKECDPITEDEIDAFITLMIEVYGLKARPNLSQAIDLARDNIASLLIFSLFQSKRVLPHISNEDFTAKIFNYIKRPVDTRTPTPQSSTCDIPFDLLIMIVDDDNTTDSLIFAKSLPI